MVTLTKPGLIFLNFVRQSKSRKSQDKAPREILESKRIWLGHMTALLGMFCEQISYEKNMADLYVSIWNLWKRRKSGLEERHAHKKVTKLKYLSIFVKVVDFYN